MNLTFLDRRFKILIKEKARGLLLKYPNKTERKYACALQVNTRWWHRGGLKSAGISKENLYNILSVKILMGELRIKCIFFKGKQANLIVIVQKDQLQALNSPQSDKSGNYSIRREREKRSKDIKHFSKFSFMGKQSGRKRRRVPQDIKRTQNDEGLF